MLPDTLIVGPTRSGTTWLDAYLRARDDVVLPRSTKETYFFDKRYDRGLAWYEAQFPTCGQPRSCVEVAPSLFHKVETPSRVAVDLPRAQAVCILRDPVERAISHYFHYRRAGEPARSFSDMVALRPDILEAGMYHRHVTRWLAALGEGRVHMLRFDDLQGDPDRFCGQLCGLLGVPYMAPPPDLPGDAVNRGSVPRFGTAARLVFRGAGALRRLGADGLVNAFRSERVKDLVYGRSVDPGERSRIAAEAAGARTFFREDLERLEDLFGFDLAKWK